MFCSRMSSGSSAAETIHPKTERKARFIRCHMNGILARDCVERRETVSTVSHGWQGRARSGFGLFDAWLRAPFRSISRLAIEVRPEGPAGARDRSWAWALLPRSCGARARHRPRLHRDAPRGLRPHPRACSAPRPLKPGRPPGRREAALAPPLPAGRVVGGARAVSRSVVEEAA